MDLTSLGIDLGIIVAIGAITEYIKSLDKNAKLKRIYVLLPVLLAVIASVGIAVSTKEWSTILINTIKYFGITSFGYSFIKKALLNK